MNRLTVEIKSLNKKLERGLSLFNLKKTAFILTIIKALFTTWDKDGLDYVIRVQFQYDLSMYLISKYDLLPGHDSISLLQLL